MHRLLPLAILILTITLVGRELAPPTVAAPLPQIVDPSHPFAGIQGMTISCHGSGLSWGSDNMVDAMRQLKELGVNWIAIHPYAGIRGDGTVSYEGRRGGMYRDPTWLTRPIREAKALGLKIMIKPHIAYWGSPFSWRGDIRFETEEQWQRFFSSYETWITMVAELCSDADAFVVGTELDQTLRFDEQWRAIISKVRARTKAPLTYAANWDQYRRVTFWDDLDAVGIQGYFPLVAHEETPTDEELAEAWDRLLERLNTYAASTDRPIVLTELGYNRSILAAREPWSSRSGGAGAEDLQRRCLSIALAALERPDAVTGSFLWKWFPDSGRRNSGNFRKTSPAMRAVIRSHWQ